MTEISGETRPNPVSRDPTGAASARLALPLGVSGMAALAGSVAVLTGVLPLGVGDLGRDGAASVLLLVGTVALANSFRHLGPNVGGYDRSSRFVFGAVLVGAGSVGVDDPWLAVGLYLAIVGVAALVGGRPVVGTAGLVGVTTLATAVVARCPVNLALGIDTCDRTDGE